MEHLSVENGKLKKEDLPLQLNQIARVTFTTAKPLFFEVMLKDLGIGEEYYEAVEKVVKELDRQGITVKIEK